MVKKETILTDNGEKVVELKNPKGRHEKKALKLLMAAEEDGVEGLGRLLDYVDEVAAEMTGMTVEELDDLDRKEKEKITGHYLGMIQDKVDFIQSSLNLQGSSQKGTPQQ